MCAHLRPPPVVSPLRSKFDHYARGVFGGKGTLGAYLKQSVTQASWHSAPPFQWDWEGCEARPRRVILRTWGNPAKSWMIDARSGGAPKEKTKGKKKKKGA